MDTAVITVGVPSMARLYVESTFVIAVGELLIIVAIKYHAEPVYINSLLFSSTNPWSPALIPVFAINAAISAKISVDDADAMDVNEKLLLPSVVNNWPAVPSLILKSVNVLALAPGTGGFQVFELAVYVYVTPPTVAISPSDGLSGKFIAII